MSNNEDSNSFGKIIDVVTDVVEGLADVAKGVLQGPTNSPYLNEDGQSLQDAMFEESQRRRYD